MTGDRSVVSNWRQDRVSNLRFCSLESAWENASDANFGRLLERERPLKFKRGKQRHVSAAPFADSAGNDMWSVNVVVGDGDGTFIEGGLPTERYEKESEQ